MRHVFCTFDELAAQRAFGLEPHDQDRHISAPEIMPQVVDDPPAVAHAGARDNDGGLRDVVELL